MEAKKFEGKPAKVNLILLLRDYKTPNFRLDGLRKLQKVGAPIPSPIYVVPHEVFLYYEKSPNKCIRQLEKEITKPAQECASLSNKGTIALRRAYDVPGLANPRGPRFLGLKPQELVKGIIELFDFAIARKYNIPGSQIACFFYPFIDPANKPLQEIERDDVLPFGGFVVPLTADASRFQILATWGNNETLENYEERGKPIEAYDIEASPENPQRIRIAKKEIVHKDVMHYTTKKGESAIVPVPLSHQLQQVMYDSEIIEVARYITLLMRKYGPQRVEFSSDGDKVFFNESIGFERELKGPEKEFRRNGEIFVVSSVSDAKRLLRLSNKELSSVLVYATDRRRGSPTNNALARTFEKKPLVVLYAGTARTAHAMKVFSDMGHFVFPIGQQELLEGDMVSIRTEGVSVLVENLTLESVQEVVSLSTAYKRGISEVGGKAERISYLKAKGYNVPNGGVFTTKFFDEVLDKSGANKVLNSILASPREFEDIEKSMHEAIYGLPDETWNKVVPFLERFGLLSREKRVAVRSSANVEDVRSHSFAGVFETIANVAGEQEIRKAVLACIRSAFSTSVTHYLGRKNVERLKEIKLALIIQEMVDSRISGTAFGGDPQSKDRSVIVIEVKRGSGSAIVEGGEVEERLILTKEKGEFKLREGQRLLTEPEETLLFLLPKRLEDEFDYPQDIEWSIDKNNNLWILQSRDL